MERRFSLIPAEIGSMREAKSTARATVRIGYDGTVHKFFQAAHARERFENELRVLQYLEQRGCDFVPRVLDYNRDTLELVTSNCGQRVQQMSDEKLQSLFHELESFGVRHDDPFLRNITYRASDGRFCIIDFEFATILDEDGSTSAQQGAAQAFAARQADAKRSLRIKWSATTECGSYRANNEDDCLSVAFNMEEFIYLARQGDVPVQNFDYIFAVSDGMGGERSGEFASKFALDNITRLLSRRYQFSPAHHQSGIHECLDELFHGIHRQLTTLGESYEEGRNMGATLSLVWYVGGWIYFGHIGDSRIYYLPREGGLQQVSHDHTHVGWLRRSGKLNEREARYHPRKNVLSQSLGAGNRYITPQIGEIRCDPGDKFVLCTDGVTDGLWDRAIEDLIRRPPTFLADLPPAERLVRAALHERSKDNATALVVEIHADHSAEASHPESGA